MLCSCLCLVGVLDVLVVCVGVCVLVCVGVCSV